MDYLTLVGGRVVDQSSTIKKFLADSFTTNVRRVPRKVLDAKTSRANSRITPRLKGYPDNALRNNPNSYLPAAPFRGPTPLTTPKRDP